MLYLSWILRKKKGRSCKSMRQLPPLAPYWLRLWRSCQLFSTSGCFFRHFEIRSERQRTIYSVFVNIATADNFPGWRKTSASSPSSSDDSFHSIIFFHFSCLSNLGPFPPSLHVYVTSCSVEHGVVTIFAFSRVTLCP